jgi:hypothetical protein
MGDATMDMLGVDSFHMSYQDGIILFKRGADGKVNKIVIMVSGGTLQGPKEAGTTMRREDLDEQKKGVAVR